MPHAFAILSLWADQLLTLEEVDGRRHCKALLHLGIQYRVE